MKKRLLFVTLRCIHTEKVFFRGILYIFLFYSHKVKALQNLNMILLSF